MARLRRQRGISLPEVLVAAVLLGLAVLCISPLMTYSFRTSRLSKEHSAAVLAGQRLVEQIRNAGYGAAASIVSPSTTSAVLADDLQGQKLYITGNGEVFTQPRGDTKLLQVQRLYFYSPGATASPADDVIQVTVKINWPGSSGQNVTMGTTLARSVSE